jgi:hypothetical protein
MFVTEEPVVKVIPADEKTLRTVFRLSVTEARLLNLLLKQEWVGQEDFDAIDYSLRQIVYTLRRKIRPLGLRAIVNDGRGRYAVSTAGKVAISRAIERALTLGE